MRHVPGSWIRHGEVPAQAGQPRLDARPVGVALVVVPMAESPALALVVVPVAKSPALALVVMPMAESPALALDGGLDGPRVRARREPGGRIDAPVRGGE